MPETEVAAAPEVIGNTVVALYVPSKFQNGSGIPQARRDSWVTKIRGDLTGAGGFTGASSNAVPVLGTFRHTKDGSGRIVDEPVTKVWCAAFRADLTPGHRKLVESLAQEMCDDLDQECVLIEWDGEFAFANRSGPAKERTPFRDLPMLVRETYISVAWLRADGVRSLATLLNLDAWEALKVDKSTANAEASPLVAFAQRKSKKEVRTAWEWRSKAPPPDQEFEDLAVGDVVFRFVQDESGSGIEAWLKEKSGVAGPRAIPLVPPGQSVKRVAVEFGLCLLDANPRMKLGEFLDTTGVTARFYREFADLRDRLAATGHWKGTGASEADRKREADRFLGRLMFMAFIQQKGWLGEDRDYLGSLWRKKGRKSFHSELRDAFKDLNSNGGNLPYLNGGLFQPSEQEEQVEFPDALFDPEEKGSVLKLFNRYDFTLEESAPGDEVVSVSPSMFGLVLESLSEERKSRGVHYTPAAIARTLAVHGIAEQVARKCRAAGTNIDAEVVRRVLDRETIRTEMLSVEQAETILKVLPTLRILDPAVGSGSLLMACLEVLLSLAMVSKDVLGEKIDPRKPAWVKLAIGFVRDCLFGVDISADAIEVARLRLWLFIAVAQDRPSPLPHLGFNLRVGDSLAVDPAERHLVREVERHPDALSLFEKELNVFKAKLAAYRAAKSPEELRRAFTDLEVAETALREKNAVGKTSRRKGVPAFPWAIHFNEVFQGENRGFDVVIANPPYVRIQQIPAETREDLAERYFSMKRNNPDLSLAFVERALWEPVDEEEKKRGRGWAGKAGTVAYILPSFASSKAGAGLRQLLADGSHVNLWVDFREHQVFKTASNYTALLFARAERSDSKTFDARVVTQEGFDRALDGMPFVDREPGTRAAYAGATWDIRTEEEKDFEKKLKAFPRLGDLATIEVGIQTSADDVFLRVEDSDAKVAAGGIRLVGLASELERRATRPCAKGSRDLVPFKTNNGRVVIWPYDESGELISGGDLGKKAWDYLLANERRLRDRQNKKFDGPKWWQFGRSQGIKLAREPKVLVPAAMNRAIAVLDEEGGTCCTASGCGGGGAWMIVPKPKSGLSLRWLTTVLNSEVFWRWVQAAGEPKKGGWRGVDKARLAKFPIALPSAQAEKSAAKVTREAEKLALAGKPLEAPLETINLLVAEAYGLRKRAQR